MNAEELKLQLREIFGKQVIFNKEFDWYAESLKEKMLQDFISWCKQIRDDELPPLRSRKRDILVFVKRIGSTNRCIVLKIVNDEFKEIHLSDHHYYDTLMKNLGLKKSSKMY